MFVEIKLSKLINPLSSDLLNTNLYLLVLFSKKKTKKHLVIESIPSCGYNKRVCIERVRC